jgi:teichuronic acid biosynthesis glycosyltransferase TuaC
VPAREPAVLAATIDTLLSDPGRLAQMRTEARDTVCRAFTWERCGRETVAAYEEVLGG